MEAPKAYVTKGFWNPRLLNRNRLLAESNYTLPSRKKQHDTHSESSTTIRSPMATRERVRP